MNLPTLAEWNWYVLMLNQALIGAVSINFRMVSITYEEEVWIINVVLEKDDDEDREEITDVADECAIYISGLEDEISEVMMKKKITTNIVVSKEPIIISNKPTERIVFCRRES